MGGPSHGPLLCSAGEHPRRAGDGRRARRDVRGDGGRPLEQRLIECLAAAQLAGGDRRGQQSASLLIVERNGGYAQLSDVVADLRVDDHPRPIEELQRIYALHDRLFGKTPRAEWLPLEGTLGDEVRERLAGLGYDSLLDWAGVENLEERVDGTDAIDPVVLEALREVSA
jgi:uncharacterized Ntn-hydrolase superfamily protein